MIVATRPASGELRQSIAADGFVFVRGAAMRQLLSTASPLSDFETFAASWNDLGLDTYMADGGRYRRRRHATYTADAFRIARAPHQPHYQGREYNPLNGGIARWFEPVRPEIGAGATMTAVLGFCSGLFGELSKDTQRAATGQFTILQELGAALRGWIEHLLRSATGGG